MIVFLAALYIISVSFMFWLANRTYSKQIETLNKEMAKLLDRVQAGSLHEYKAQERADKPKPVKAPDELERINKLPWA